MPGARPHPQPCVQWKKARQQVTTGTPKHPAFPARWFSGLDVLLVYRRCTGLLVTVASPNRLRRNLIPASGDQDHTILPSALISLAWRYRRVHRILFQRLWRLAERHSVRIGMRGYTHTFRKTRSKILMPGTEISDHLNAQAKSAFSARRRSTFKSETMAFDLCRFEIVLAAAP
jgi:hypothetical protein